MESTSYSSSSEPSSIFKIGPSSKKTLSELNVDKLPSYLMELKFGEALYAGMLGAMTSSPSALPTLIKSREMFKRRLASFGVLGKLPGQFMQDDSYCDELIEIFRNRSTPQSSSGRSDQMHAVEDIEAIAASEKYIDRQSPGLISSHLWNEPDEKDAMELEKHNKNRFEFKLPSGWNIIGSSSFKSQKDDSLLLSTPKSDRNAHGFSSSNPTAPLKPSLAWSNKDVPTDCPIYYYEITITEGLQAADVSLGFLYENVDKYLNHLPGVEIRSYGYNGKDGKIHCKSESISEVFGAKFGINDVIGCGINRLTRTIFYTKNGILLGDAFQDIKKKSVYPCIGMGDFITVKTNFGMKNDGGNFSFDIDNYVKSYKTRVSKSVANTTFTSNNDKKTRQRKRNLLKEEDIPAVLNTFVLSHLNHSGFAQTYAALTEDLKKQEYAFADLREISEDEEDDEELEELSQREKIRVLLSNGDIEHLIQYLQDNYSSAFGKDHEAIFRLKSLKLINMIKFATLQKQDELIMRAIDYGSVLKDEYNDDASRTSYLNDISSLLAFEDPLNSKYGYLMKELEVEKHFNELNKVILQNQGRDQSSIFERIVFQIEAILCLLVKDGNEEAALINMGKDYL